MNDIDVWFSRNKNRINLSTLGIIMCALFTACAGQTNQGEATAITPQTSQTVTPSVAQQNESDIMIPEKLTMELFGMNLLETNRSMWEKYVYSVYDVGEDDGMGTRILVIM